MRAGDHGFFRAVGGDPLILDRFFDLGWVWRHPPAAFLDLTLDELILYEAQTMRILDAQRRAQSRV